MTKDEALDLALEALEELQPDDAYPYSLQSKAITAIKQARSAPVQEPVAFNAGVPPLYPEMKDGETISVEYTTPPGGRQSEDCLTAAQEDIQRLSALVRAQQITIDKLEQARSAPVQEPVAVVKVLPLGDGHKPMHWADWTNADNPPPEGTLLHTAVPVQEPDHGDELTIAYMSGVHRGKELARADEREACAKVAEWEPCMTDTPKRIAAAIRARSKDEK